MIESSRGTRPVVVAGRRATEISVSSFTVRVESGVDRGASAALASTSLRIGTDTSNDLVLSDPGVSRKHLLLTLTDAGVRVEDLRSKNGTRVDGTRIECAFVPDGGLIEIGATALRCRLEGDRLVVFPEETGTFFGILSRTPAMRDIFALVRQLARVKLPVLITGETGTGKELIARALHEAGPRKDRPYLVLDCGSILPELLKSELFGHEKGAFTGADQQRKGILELAHGGTVLLDEIGEVDLAVQAMLLRALETREVVRVGAARPVPVEVRIVAATNRNLAELTQRERFREDLLYRLSGVTIGLPPLRDRVEDLDMLAESFAARAAKELEVPAPSLTPGAMEALRAHRWPGNVRELKHVMEALLAVTTGRPIAVEDVRQRLAGAPSARQPAALDGVEKREILRALKAARWNRAAAARALGIARSTLYQKIRGYGIQAPWAGDE